MIQSRGNQALHPQLSDVVRAPDEWQARQSRLSNGNTVFRNTMEPYKVQC